MFILFYLLYIYISLFLYFIYVNSIQINKPVIQYNVQLRCSEGIDSQIKNVTCPKVKMTSTDDMLCITSVSAALSTWRMHAVLTISCNWKF